MSSKGQFIVVEGLEGAGKSTALETIKLYLNTVVSELILTREPGGTSIGEAIRSLIKNKRATRLDARCELLLLYASRVQHVEEIIRPALERGAWVLSDRFELSTFAYQGWGRGLDLNIINQLSAFCLQSFKPDLIIYLDINPEQGLRRAEKRGEMDRIEQESLDFFMQVREGYRQMLQKMTNIISIDASQEINTVQESIITQLKTYIAQNAKQS